AAHRRVRGEYRLDLLGVERAGGGLDPLALAAAEPQAPLLVEPAEVAHAVHDAFAAIGKALADLGLCGLARAMEVAVGGGRPGDRDLADFAGRQLAHAAPLGDRPVVDGDDPHLVRRHRAPDAGTGARFG